MSKIGFITRALLIVGLIMSPLYPRAFAGADRTLQMPSAEEVSEQVLPMIGAVGGDLLPCDEGNADCGKICACMAACVTLGNPGLPSAAGAVTSPVVAAALIAAPSEVQLASLAATPPARPPRA